MAMQCKFCGIKTEGQSTNDHPYKHPSRYYCPGHRGERWKAVMRARFVRELVRERRKVEAVL